MGKFKETFDQEIDHYNLISLAQKTEDFNKLWNKFLDKVFKTAHQNVTKVRKIPKKPTPKKDKYSKTLESIHYLQ